jgi:uncharacterized protein (TIGR02118 family)
MENLNLPALFCWTILYPNKDNASFDFELYSKTLIPEYVQILGTNCVRYEVRRGLGTPGASAPGFVCIANFWITSREQLRESMGDPRMKALLEKLSSFTEIPSLRQLDQVIADPGILQPLL